MPERLTDAALEGLEAALRAATPGTWVVDWHEDGRKYGSGHDGIYREAQRGEEHWERKRIVESDSGVYPPEPADAALIVALHNAAPALMAEVRALRAERFTLRTAIAAGPTKLCPHCNATIANVGVLTSSPALCGACRKPIVDGEPAKEYRLLARELAQALESCGRTGNVVPEATRAALLAKARAAGLLP